MTLEEIKRFFTSRYVLHLESQVERLQGQNAMLQVQLIEAFSRPTVAPAPRPVVPRYVPPAKTSWEAFRDAEMVKQEQEEAV